MATHAGKMQQYIPHCISNMRAIVFESETLTHWQDTNWKHTTELHKPGVCGASQRNSDKWRQRKHASVHEPPGFSEGTRCGHRTATSVAQAPARTSRQFFAPWAESLAYTQQAPTILRSEVVPIHVVHDLGHARSELQLGLANFGACKLRAQEVPDVADGRLVRIDVATPGGQPRSASRTLAALGSGGGGGAKIENREEPPLHLALYSPRGNQVPPGMRFLNNTIWHCLSPTDGARTQQKACESPNG